MGAWQSVIVWLEGRSASQGDLSAKYQSGPPLGWSDGLSPLQREGSSLWD